MQEKKETAPEVQVQEQPDKYITKVGNTRIIQTAKGITIEISDGTKEMGDSETRLSELEKRIAALEGRFENGKELLEEIIDTWHDALAGFVIKLNAHAPRTEEIIKKIRQRE